MDEKLERDDGAMLLEDCQARNIKDSVLIFLNEFVGFKRPCGIQLVDVVAQNVPDRFCIFMQDKAYRVFVGQKGSEILSCDVWPSRCHGWRC